MLPVSAKVKVYKNEPIGDPVYAHSVHLSADYADGKNKEWAYATPSLNLGMTVIPAVAKQFPVGRAFTLIFDPEPEPEVVPEDQPDGTNG